LAEHRPDSLPDSPDRNVPSFSTMAAVAAAASVAALGAAVGSGAAAFAIWTSQQRLVSAQHEVQETRAEFAKRGAESAAKVPPPPPAPAPATEEAVAWRRRSRSRSSSMAGPEFNKELNVDCLHGFSMEEARMHAELGCTEAAARTPFEVLADLQRGNARFWMGAATRPERSAFERRALISKQFPSVAILACADSRVPSEIIFDQGLGDMFVVRVAGNCLDTSTHASLQYAVHHLKVKVLMVMGHENCGAVKAAGMENQAIEGEPAALCQCLKSIKRGIDLEHLANLRDPRAYDREAVISNVTRQVEGLTGDAGIMSKVSDGELMIVGAFYEMSIGIVDFVSEVSQTAEPSEFSETAEQPSDDVSTASSDHEEVPSPQQSPKAKGVVIVPKGVVTL